MRDIKFRVWDKEDQLMWDIGRLNWACDGSIMDCGYTDEMDKVELMQYTGLHDKHDREVYESDVVRHDSGHGHIVYGVVKFGRMPADFDDSAKQIGFYIEWQNDGANIWNDWWRHDVEHFISERDAVVVGNIYENLELLEEMYSLS